MCKHQQITHKLFIKPFGLYSVASDLLAKSTKIKFIIMNMGCLLRGSQYLWHLGIIVSP